MKKIILSLFLAATVILPLRAQKSNLEYIHEDRTRCASNFNDYETFDISVTAAPKGFKPFYISHYGRHGSRYFITSRQFDIALQGLKKCDSLGILTDEGKQIVRDIEYLQAESEGRYGELTNKGARQHRDISSRMCANYPEVFNNPKRNQVECTCSNIGRCIQSMGNFCLPLYALNPSLEINQFAGKRYLEKYVPHRALSEEDKKFYQEFRDSLYNADFNTDHFCSTLFTDSEKAKAAINLRRIAYYIYECGTVSENMDCQDPDILRIFTDEELVTLLCRKDLRFAAMYFKSKETAGMDNCEIARDAARHIIDEADEAIKADSRRAADLRFYHDSGIAPLLCFMSIEPFSEVPSLKDGSETWKIFWGSCMAANIQMVFYKNKTGEVLVKVMVNETECSIHGIKPYSWPYYKWSDYKNLILAR